MSPGCSLYQDQDDEQRDPCQNHKCQNAGQCLPNKVYGTYECKCVAPFSGRFCEIKRKYLLNYSNIQISTFYGFMHDSIQFF